MGGKGSGRKPDVFVQERKRKEQLINFGGNSEELIIPNLSGVKHEIKEGTSKITTDDLAEGNNLYFTDARAVSAVSSADDYLKNDGDTASGTYDFDTSTLVVNSTTHRVGIGVANPTYRLDVAEDVYIHRVNESIKLSTDDGWATILGHSSSVDWEIGQYDSIDEENFVINTSSTGVDMVFGTQSTERMRISSDGNIGIGTTSPTEALDINSDKIRLRSSNTPSSATDTGAVGEICWDSNYIYVCVATNTWKRSSLSSW